MATLFFHLSKNGFVTPGVCDNMVQVTSVLIAKHALFFFSLNLIFGKAIYFDNRCHQFCDSFSGIRFALQRPGIGATHGIN